MDMIIPAHQSEKIKNVLRVYEQLDVKITEFQASSFLKCENGCGRCCDNPKITATILEVLPLAQELCRNSTVEQALSQVTKTKDNDVCVFYQPDALIAGHGRCSVYPWRPLLCRLFGYSTKRNKVGKSEIMTCSTIKSRHAKEYELVKVLVQDERMEAPCAQDYALKVSHIDPYFGIEQFPINQAVRNALEKMSLYEKAI